ncbi:hypothetical protein N7495_003381 [Penicillium taxi]|uniref:uncharacterized protein n=1 Tax=Penicillium taxi TaxID=168475 RepID=UPI002544E0D6|nr:uncharacterized protein N7495_003381 [Penicillium taxi]KAJ5902853.1 hypothetical protein N7495_003381 [Penicillium taxi]
MESMDTERDLIEETEIVGYNDDTTSEGIDGFGQGVNSGEPRHPALADCMIQCLIYNNSIKFLNASMTKVIQAFTIFLSRLTSTADGQIYDDRDIRLNRQLEQR